MLVSKHLRNRANPSNPEYGFQNSTFGVSTLMLEQVLERLMRLVVRCVLKGSYRWEEIVVSKMKLEMLRTDLPCDVPFGFECTPSENSSHHKDDKSQF